MSYLGQYLAGLARMIAADKDGDLPPEEDEALDRELTDLWFKLSPQERAQAKDWYASRSS